MSARMYAIEDLQLERRSDGELVDVYGESWVRRADHCIIDPETMTDNDGLKYVCVDELYSNDQALITFVAGGDATDEAGNMWWSESSFEDLDEELRNAQDTLETVLSVLDISEVRDAIASLDFIGRQRVERSLVNLPPAVAMRFR